MTRSWTETKPCMQRVALAVAAALLAAGAQAQVAVEYGTAATRTAPSKTPTPVTKAAVNATMQPAGAATAAAPKAAIMRPLSKTPATGNVEMAPQVYLSEGKSTLMRLPSPASRLSVGDPRIADVILLNPSEIYMLGKTIGTTNLIVWDRTNDATIIDIAVNIDTTALQSRIAMLLPDEKNVKVTTAADTLILSGTVSDVVKADQVMALANAYVQRSARGSQGGGGAAAGGAEAGGAGGAGGAMAGGAGAGGQSSNVPKVVNMMGIAAPQQVMLEVKVAEISKTLVDQLGASVGASKTRGSWTYTLLSNLLNGVPGVVDGFNNRNGNFATLDAQVRNGLIKVLAEPTVMAISGQEASFLAGGKIFIPVAQNNNGGQQTITLEEKEFGVAVKFTPTVLEGGRINLKVAPEVSDLNRDGVGISANGTNTTAILPSFTTRRATTTVQLYDGQSFAIGGLIKNNVTQNIKALPVLGEVPVLGALFSSKDFQTDRTELVFIITPHLVKPLTGDYPLPTDGFIEPTRSEFFLEGKMEGSRPPVQARPAAPAAAVAPAGSATGFELK